MNQNIWGFLSEVGGKGFAIESAVEAFIGIGATYTAASDTVKSMPLEKRKCLKHSENLMPEAQVHLDVFKNYSRKACLLECQARQLQEDCGCLPYYFPDFSKIWKKDTTCNLKGLQCLSNVSSTA